MPVIKIHTLQKNLKILNDFNTKNPFYQPKNRQKLTKQTILHNYFYFCVIYSKRVSFFLTLISSQKNFYKTKKRLSTDSRFLFNQVLCKNCRSATNDCSDKVYQPADNATWNDPKDAGDKNKTFVFCCTFNDTIDAPDEVEHWDAKDEFYDPRKVIHCCYKTTFSHNLPP